MTISIPPVAPISVSRACGDIPLGGWPMPLFAQESTLPDDLLLSAQGIQFESYNPLPQTGEGEFSTAVDPQFRRVTVRRSTPEGTITRTVIVAEVGDAAAVLGSSVRVEVAPQSESVVETLTQEAELPAAEYYEDDTSTASAPRKTAEEMQQRIAEIKAESEAVSAARAATGTSAPVSTPSAPVAVSTSSGSYAASAPTYTESGTSSITYQGGGTSSITYGQHVSNQNAASQTQSTLEQLEVMGQEGFNWSTWG